VAPRDRVGHLLAVTPGGLTPATPFEGHGGHVRDAAFTPDGERVFTASVDLGLRAFHVATAAPVEGLAPRGHVGWVAHVASAAPRGAAPLLATGGADGTVRLWDPSTREPLGLARLPQPASALGFSPDGARLFAATPAGDVVVWEVPSLREVARGRPLKPEEGGVRSATFVGERVVAVSDRGGWVRVWDPTRPGDEGSMLPLPLDGGLVGQQAFSCAALGKDAVLIGLAKQALARIDDALEAVPRTQPPLAFGRAEGAGVDACVLALAPHPGGELVAALLVGGRVGVLRLASGEVVLAEKKQGKPMRGLALDPRPIAKLVASTSGDGTLALWDPATGKALDQLVAPPGDAPAGLAFSPDGARLFVGTSAGVVGGLEVQRELDLAAQR
jgi:WD40 repeat protein